MRLVVQLGRHHGQMNHAFHPDHHSHSLSFAYASALFYFNPHLHNALGLDVSSVGDLYSTAMAMRRGRA